MSDALGATPWYLRLLRDESLAAQRLAQVLASSRYASDLLLRAPEAVTMLADDAELEPRSRDALVTEAIAAARRHDDPAVAVAAVRALRRRELFRTAVAELLGVAEVDEAAVALSAIAAATVTGGLEIAVRAVEGARGTPLPTRFLVVAMGRFGGGELGFASDADVMFVHDPLPGADERDAHDVGPRRRRRAAPPAHAAHARPAAGDRRRPAPRGAQRPARAHAGVVRRLLRALVVRVGVAGAAARRARRRRRRPRPVVRRARRPAALSGRGHHRTAVREIRRLKARMEAERLPRGADPGLHTKLGRGGLSDVEWVAQLLQLQHGHEVPGLRTTRTLPALAAAVQARSARSRGRRAPRRGVAHRHRRCATPSC